MNQTQKIVLTAIMFVYTVICGIIIADIGEKHGCGKRTAFHYRHALKYR
jgi:hypothetical protein